MNKLCFFIVVVCLTSLEISAQEKINVKGTVVDEAENVLPGANIHVKDSKYGTSANFDGEFYIKVDKNAILEVSFMGFKTQEIKVNGRDEINIIMEEGSLNPLDEVIVVGYGKQRRRDVVGAISQDTLPGVNDRPGVDVRDALQGAIPGLNVQHKGGDPSKNPAINIRGFNSINGGSPLILVDGVQETLSYVNPDDVKSVTVLKDAEASAIYGSRAAFGVILITTKKGKKGDIRVDYNYSYGWSENTVRTDFLSDPYRFAKTVDAAINGTKGNTFTGWKDEDFEKAKEVANGEREPFHERQADGTYKFFYKTDWYDYMFKKRRPMEKHNISVSGGSDKFNTRLSGRIYEREKAQNIQDANMDRYNFRIISTLRPADWLEITGQARFSTRKDEQYSGIRSGWGTVYGVSRWRDQFPFFPPTINGEAVSVGRTGGGYDARVGGLMSGNNFRKKRYENLTNSVSAKATPLTGLELNFDYTNRIKRTDMTYHYAPFEFLNGNELKETTGGLDRNGEWRYKDRYQAVNFFGSYERKIAADHHLKLMLGYSQEKFDRDRLKAQMEGFPVRDKASMNLGTELYKIDGSNQDWGVEGYFGRFNYDYKDKYLLEVNARRDGSSRFPSRDRWGFFPSAAIAWRLSGEGFWSSIKDVVPNMKLRFSWGKLGNQSVPLNTFKPLLGFGQTSWLGDDGKQMFYANSPKPLPETIGWEEVTTKNIGLDFGIFGNKLTGAVEFYEKGIDNMYLPGEPLPSVFGASEPRRSYAALRNRGWELSLNYNAKFHVVGSDLSLSVNANISNNEAKITKFYNSNGILTSYYKGQKLGEMWGYETDGRFMTDEEATEFQNQFPDPKTGLSKVYKVIFTGTTNSEWDHLKAGDLKYVDRNGDGKIDDGDNTLEDHGDKKIIGNSMPKYPFGFNINIDWKGFDLGIRGQGIISQDWYPTGPLYWGTYSRPYVSFLRKDLVNQAFQNADHPGKYPQIDRGYTALKAGAMLFVKNDHYLTNIGYLRLKNLTVGYTLPKELTKKFFIRRLRVYFSAENLATIRFHHLSRYLDPEEMSSGIDYNDPADAAGRSATDTNEYPMEKTYLFGVQLTL